MEKVTFDDDRIAEIDAEMGWDDPPEDSPSQTAKRLGVRCKFMREDPQIPTAWVGKDGVWSTCNLLGIQTTLLAKSYGGLLRLLKKLREREDSGVNREKWQAYYRNLHRARCGKWLCKKNANCDCQICRRNRG